MWRLPMISARQTALRAEICLNVIPIASAATTAPVLLCNAEQREVKCQAVWMDESRSPPPISRLVNTAAKVKADSDTVIHRSHREEAESDASSATDDGRGGVAETKGGVRSIRRNQPARLHASLVVDHTVRLHA